MHNQGIVEVGTDVPMMALLSRLHRQPYVDTVQIVLLNYKHLSKCFVDTEFPVAVSARAQVDMIRIEKMAALEAAVLVLCTS